MQKKVTGSRKKKPTGRQKKGTLPVSKPKRKPTVEGSSKGLESKTR